MLTGLRFFFAQPITIFLNLRYWEGKKTFRLTPKVPFFKRTNSL